MEKRDVVIVGGGLAGLTTAKFLAEKGVDFVLLEEDKSFFKKPCGEGILPIEVEPNFFDLYGSKIGIEGEINEVVMIIGNGTLNLPITFFMIDKKKVEEEIARQIKKLGGEIRLGEKVESVDGNMVYPQNIKAKVLVGADGVRSIVRRSKRVRSPKIGIGIEGHVEELEDFEKEKAYIWFGRDIVLNGYAWAFPKKDHWNVGIGSSNVKNFRPYLERFKSRFSDIEDLRGAGIPFSLPVKTYGKDFVLVGDSASQIVTSVGAGNLTSMICGHAAAEAIFDHLEGKCSLSRYEYIWKRRLGKLFCESLMICKLAEILSRANTNLSRAMIKIMAKVFA